MPINLRPEQEWVVSQGPSPAWPLTPFPERPQGAGSLSCLRPAAHSPSSIKSSARLHFLRERCSFLWPCFPRIWKGPGTHMRYLYQITVKASNLGRLRSQGWGRDVSRRVLRCSFDCKEGKIWFNCKTLCYTCLINPFYTFRTND